MKRFIIFFILLLTVSSSGYAGNTAFGIYVDSKTYNECRQELEAYRDQLVSEGLHAIILHQDWKNPDEVRTSIHSLASDKKTPLEGVVFVGEIPIVMVREAQWMTTAFKMNEERFPIFDSSVASDRFYDDFDLSFDFISKDSEHEGIFYYRLNSKGKTHLHPDIYSARMKVPEIMVKNGYDKYQLMRNYLKKVVDAHKENNPLDRIAFFFGSGYNSEDLNVWRQKSVEYKEHFPLAYNKASGNRFLTFFANDETKWNIFNELQRDDTDLFQFTEHGDFNTQFINGETGGRDLREILRLLKGSEEEKSGEKGQDNKVIDQKELFSVRSNPKVLIFNACYNGSFHNPEGYIAGVYLFGEGKAVVAQGNTVNVLQDKFEDKLIGYLSLGIRIGLWQKEVPYLENHLLGDPTFMFSATSSALARRLTHDLITNPDNAGKWKKYLKSDNPVLRSAGIVHLGYAAIEEEKDNNTGSIKNKVSDIALSVLKKDNSRIVRLSAFSVLRTFSDKNAQEAIVTALKDPFEMVVRHAALFAAEYGHPGKDSCILKALINVKENHPELLRVRWTAESAVNVIMEDGILASEIEKLNDTSLPVDKRVMALRTFRNNRCHAAIMPALQILFASSADASTRRNAAEMLGWYSGSAYRNEILNSIRNFSSENNGDIPDRVREEVEKTVRRLENR